MKLKDKRKKDKVQKTTAFEAVLRDLQFQISRQVELARLKKGFTQEELAVAMNTKQPNISRIERGSFLPSLRFLKKMADLFDTYLIVEFGFLREQSEETVSHEEEYAHYGWPHFKHGYVSVSEDTYLQSSILDTTKTKLFVT